jgi:hypothetical protein
MPSQPEKIDLPGDLLSGYISTTNRAFTVHLIITSHPNHLRAITLGTHPDVYQRNVRLYTSPDNMFIVNTAMLRPCIDGPRFLVLAGYKDYSGRETYSISYTFFSLAEKRKWIKNVQKAFDHINVCEPVIQD